jgi:hypothetical protein
MANGPRFHVEKTDATRRFVKKPDLRESYEWGGNRAAQFHEFKAYWHQRT